MAGLTKTQIKNFKKKLEELKEQIGRSAKGVANEVTKPEEGSGYSQHQADSGTDDFGRTINIEVSSKEFEILKQIDRALEKIEEGTYGVCEISGDPIPVPRLEAVPYATMTVASQEKHEKGLL